MSRRHEPAKRLTAGDVILTGLLAAASLLPFYLWRDRREAATRALVQADNGKTITVSLENDGRHNVDGPLGMSVVEVSRGKIRMLRSPCLNQLCVREGWKAMTGQLVVCVPNRVTILVTGAAGGVDAVSR